MRTLFKEQSECMSPDLSKAVPEGGLTDIRDIKIDTGLPWEARMVRYLDQIGNPYRFLCDGTSVRISFDDGGQELSRALVDYFRTLK